MASKREIVRMIQDAEQKAKDAAKLATVDEVRRWEQKGEQYIKSLSHKAKQALKKLGIHYEGEVGVELGRKKDAYGRVIRYPYIVLEENKQLAAIRRSIDAAKQKGKKPIKEIEAKATALTRDVMLSPNGRALPESVVDRVRKFCEAADAAMAKHE